MHRTMNIKISINVREVFPLSVDAVPCWNNCWWNFNFSIKIKSVVLQSCILTCQYKELFMKIYDLWITCSICQLFWLATSETQIPLFVITHWHISSVIAPHISIFRAPSSMSEPSFLGNSFLLRCPKEDVTVVMSGLLCRQFSPYPW